MNQRRNKHSRMAFLGTLAGGLAHEIRNPLSTIKVNLQLLRDELARLEDPRLERSRHRVNTLDKAVGRMEEILDDFLNFARGFELVIEPADLNQVLGEVAVFVEPEARRLNIDLRTAFDASLPPVPIDRKYIQQALLNLVLNARQAIELTGRGGEIFLTTRRSGDSVTVNVTDTGPGIPKEVLPRIFDAYFSTKKGGTGLGLPTCRRIAEEHGGRLTVETVEGKGTSFNLVLPLVARIRQGVSD